MAELKLPTKPAPNWERVRDDWVRAVEQLVADVEGWCRENNWPTRRIPKRLTESPIGEYVVPALHLQFDLVQLLLEPVARFVPGAEGVTDLYSMPRYDDVASIYRREGAWQVQYTATGDAIPPELRRADPSLVSTTLVSPFTADAFAKLVKLLA